MILKLHGYITFLILFVLDILYINISPFHGYPRKYIVDPYFVYHLSYYQFGLTYLYFTAKNPAPLDSDIEILIWSKNNDIIKQNIYRRLL